jgi:hypothetical protein
MKIANTLLVVLATFLCLSLFASPAVAGPKGAKPKPAASAAAEPEADPPSGEAPAQAATVNSAAAADDDALPPKHEPVTMKVGVELESISKFDIANQTFNVELNVNVTCDREPCHPDLDIKNGSIQGKPEKLHDEPLEKRFKIKAEVDGYIDLTEYPHDDHALLVMLQDKGDPEQVKYDVDYEFTGMNPRVRIPGWDIDEDAPAKDMIVARTDNVGDEKEPELVSYVAFGIRVHRPRMASTFKTLVPPCFMLFVAAFALLLKPKSAAGGP